MFNLFLYIFAIWGIIISAASLLKFFLRTKTPAIIIYPMEHDDGDRYCSLRTLNGLTLPVVAIKDGKTDTKTLEKEFLYTEFIEKTDFLQYMEDKLK